jgi:hypothetical protein
MSVTLDHRPLDGLDVRIAGSVLFPHDPGYDEARGVPNGLIDRGPALTVHAGADSVDRGCPGRSP